MRGSGSAKHIPSLSTWAEIDGQGAPLAPQATPVLLFRRTMSAVALTGTHPCERRDFKIIDETDDYIVVDKPPLLLVHPSKPDGSATLWAELRHLLAFEIAAGGKVSIVNRLDRETSGVVLVAKKADVARRFGLLMQRRQLKKEYLAIVCGW